MNVSLKITIRGIPVIGKMLFYRLLVRREGGSFTSKTLREYTKIAHKVDVGMYSYGGCFDKDFNYNIGGSVKIGKYCSFASGIRYFGANHPIENVTTSPLFYNPQLGFDVRDVRREELIIGHDVWCGYGVLITSKCKKIGNGAVIAAGSIVTKDVSPYTVVAGNPAAVIRYRFDDETIKELEKSQWWQYSPADLIGYYALINSPIAFCSALRK